MTWDMVYSIAAVLAVAVASIAVITTQRAIRKERAHQRVVERHRAATELLAAFEAIQILRAPHYSENAAEQNDRNDQLKIQHARCVALLRASEEELPISRGMFFRHISYRANDPAEAAHFAQGRLEGDPETETDDVMRVRGEIVDTIESLRRRLNHP